MLSSGRGWQGPRKLLSAEVGVCLLRLPQEPSCEGVEIRAHASALGKVKNACPPFAVTGSVSYLFRKHFHSAQMNSFCHFLRGSAASC